MQKTDRDGIVAEALRLFKLNGYHRTTMADIGQACGLLKGSIYHYFPGKEAVAVAAMERVLTLFREQVFCWAYEESLPPRARLEKMIAATELYFWDSEGGCLMGNLTLELIDALPAFAPPIRGYFDEWCGALAHVLTSAHPPQTASRLARDGVAKIQGAVLMMRVYGDAEVLHRVDGEILALVPPNP